MWSWWNAHRNNVSSILGGPQKHKVGVYYISSLLLILSIIDVLVFTETPRVPENPCIPSPCGPNSICQVKQGRPVCSCVANYIGSPPFCRPECVLSQECPWDKACINEKCQNPCINSCGSNAKCDVVNHTPFCSCLAGYIGDAFIGCSKIVTRKYLHDKIL